MKKLILSALVFFAALSAEKSWAQNATGNASDNGVPIAASITPPQTTPGAVNSVGALNAVALTVPTAPPVVTAPVTITNSGILPAAPGAPAPPPAPTTTTPSPSTSSTTVSLARTDVPPTPPLAANPDINLANANSNN